MCRALIQTSNTAQQNIAVNSIINPGATIRRFGCNCKLNGNAIELNGDGYYTVDAVVTVAPTVAGAVTVALVLDGTQVPSAVASGSVSTASSPVTLPISTTIRRGCCADSVGSFTLVLLAGAGVVSNVSVRAEKV